MIPIVSAALIGLASAYTQPVGDTPSGNPIVKPSLGEVVPVGTPYTINWNPTTQGTVTLVLLRGPSTNVIPLYPIAEKVANTGSYVWTPSTSLEPDTTHYGIQLVVDATGQYQYTTQFGIGNPSFGSSSSSSSSAAAPSTTTMSAVSQIADGQIQAPASAVSVASAAYPVNSANATSSSVVMSSSVAMSPSVALSSSIATSIYVPVSSVNAPYVASTGFPVSNSSIIQPTGSMSVPATLQTMTAVASATQATAASSSTAPARATGAAGRVVMSAGGLVAGAGAVLALLM